MGTIGQGICAKPGLHSLFADAAEAPKPPGPIERALSAGLVVVFCCALVFAFAGVFLTTLGFDEAWTLQGFESLSSSRSQGAAVDPRTTSGGLFAVTNMIVQELWGSKLWAHRMLSWLCLLGTCWMVVRWGPRGRSGRLSALIPAVMVVGVPGTLFLAASAYANTHALLLFLLTLQSMRIPTKGIRKWIVCGVLAGLTAATRSEYILGIVGIAFYLALRKGDWRRRLADSATVAAAGALTAFVCSALLQYLSPAHGSLSGLAWSAGVTGYLWDYPAILNKWLVGSFNFVLPLAAISSIAGWAMDRDSVPSVRGRWMILVIVGWLIWLAWLSRSPFAHLRYLWPSLASFAIVAGFGLARLHEWGASTGNATARIASLVIAIAYAGSGLGAAARASLEGDSNIITAESSGYAALDYFRRFQHVQDQWATVDYIKKAFAPDEKLGIIGADRELSYLSGKRLQVLIDYSSDKITYADLPRRILVPSGTYYSLSRAGWNWIEGNCELEAQFGRYSFYKVIGDFPPPPFLFARGGHASRSVNPFSRISAGTIHE